MRILGISAFYHDSAAALIEDGSIVAAAQEERFTRIKHDRAFPEHAVTACLTQAGIELRDVDQVVFYDKPLLKFCRLVETYLAVAPKGFRSFKAAMPVWLKGKLNQKRMLREALTQLDSKVDWSRKLLFAEHHLSHAASAFFPSPFEEAAVLTMDGVGEWTTTSLAMGSGNTLAVHREIHFPHSLGLLYSAFTHYIGFRVNSGEYKVMGLAPYGEPKYTDLILDTLVNVKEDGSFWLDQSYFDYCTGLAMTNKRFEALFGQPVRRPDTDELTQFHMDVAASIQAVTDEIVLRLARSIARETGARNLCLAGGVALNCVTNGKLLREGIFDDVWIQPAAGDAGGALGAALAAYHLFSGGARKVDAKGRDAMCGTFLGPHFPQEEVERRLTAVGARYSTLDDDELIAATADALVAGKAVGWMQGRMEFGPRALGNRSILADPRSPLMQKTLNLKVKFRESFRPFAPSVLREDVGEWFELDHDSPYMLLVAPVRQEHRRDLGEAQRRLNGLDRLAAPRSSIPAVTHVDHSARIQTVTAEVNPRYHALISAFKQRTGCGLLVNTSFNVRGEPIVASPEDAFRCFMSNHIEVLVVGNCLLRKEEQDRLLQVDYSNKFAPD